MAADLNGKKIAIVVADGFEQVEMEEPRKALEDAGAEVILISPKTGEVKGWKTKEWGDKFDVDVALADANAANYDALVLPGGVMSPDKLRVLPEMRRFVRAFFDDGKPVAAICHGPWSLIDAGVIAGRKITSWPTLQTDLQNAGAAWVDEVVVVDRGLVTSRKPDDLPDFNRKMIAEFAKGRRSDKIGRERDDRNSRPSVSSAR